MNIFKNLLSKFKIIRELLTFLWQQRLWWLIPIVVGLIIIGLLVIFSQTTAIAPFIYTLF